MKRICAVTLLAVLLWNVGGLTASAGMRHACRFQLLNGQKGWTVTESKRTIRCVFRHLAPNQVDQALNIADRESNYVATAYNSWSGASGLFQHLPRYWDGRVRDYARPYWFPWAWPRLNPFNARANSIVTARMVAAHGWGPWQ